MTVPIPPKGAKTWALGLLLDGAVQVLAKTASAVVFIRKLRRKPRRKR